MTTETSATPTPTLPTVATPTLPTPTVATPTLPTPTVAPQPLATLTASGARCFGTGDPLYEAYHDTEWGVPVRGEHELFERVSLEAFQSGLSWLTILRKRPAFRAAFAGFDPEVVARYGDDDVTRLLADAAIVRNRLKISATIANARAILALWEGGRTLSELFWSHAPEPAPSRPTSPAEVPAQTDGSRALAKELKSTGFRFVGPVTAYASMQACGLVDDHLTTCPVVMAAGSALRSAAPQERD